jgi:hypothetical protein
MSDEVLVAQQQQQDRNKESLIDLTNRIYDTHVVTGGLAAPSVKVRGLTVH